MKKVNINLNWLYTLIPLGVLWIASYVVANINMESWIGFPTMITLIYVFFCGSCILYFK